MTPSSPEPEAGKISVWQEIHSRSATKPGDPLILSPHRSPVTSRQLWTRMDHLAARLRDEGMPPGATVALVLPEGPHLLATILAVSRDFACAPINPALTATELHACLAALTPYVLLMAPEFLTAAEVGRQLGLTVFEAHEESAGLPAEWRLLAKGACCGSRREEIGLILETSATTGRCKLVGLTRSNLEACLRSTWSALDLTESDRVLLLSPLFHLQGILSAMSQIYAGGSAVAPCGFSRDDFVWWLDLLRPTWYTCGPTMHRALCSLLEGVAPHAPGLRPHSLRFVRSIGAPLSPGLAAHLTQVLGAPVLNGYGMTETGVVTSLPLVCALERADSVGKSTGAEIQVWNADGRKTTAGGEGEIVLRGNSVFSGYLNDPEANRRSFRDGWFRTGDLGRLDPDGFLYVTGRLKEQINRGGEKINPAEVDEALSQHPAVEAVATFGLPHTSLGEDVACAVVLRHDAPPPGTEDLRSFAAERLAPFKLPRAIFYVDGLPRGSTGKPQRYLLTERFRSALAARTADPSSRTQAPVPQSLNGIGQQILSLWRDQLGREDLSPEEDFFSAGGDSMEAVVMLSRLEQIAKLHTVLSTESFFHDPTIAHLAAMIQALRDGEHANSPSEKIRVIPLQPGSLAKQADQAPPQFYLFPPNAQDGTAFRKLALALGPEWPVSLVRPGHMRHRDTATAIEDAAMESVAAIKTASPQGPYLVGGFCFGGLIAFEAARLLEQEGCHVSLVLFDTPVPGYPQFFWRPRFAAEHWHVLQAVVSDLRSADQAKAYAVLAIRKITWNAILLSKPLCRRVWGCGPLPWIAARAKSNDLPFFRLHRTGVPILHLLASERTNPVACAAYAAWKQVAGAGLTERELLANHVSLFSPSNLPRLAEAIRNWVLPSCDPAR